MQKFGRLLDWSSAYSIMAFRDLGRTSGIMNNTKGKKLWGTTRVCLACFDCATQFNLFYSSLAIN